MAVETLLSELFKSASVSANRSGLISHI